MLDQPVFLKSQFLEAHELQNIMFAAEHKAGFYPCLSFVIRPDPILLEHSRQPFLGVLPISAPSSAILSYPGILLSVG